MPREADLAAVIVDWLRSRNGGELEAAFGNMRLRDFERLRDELEYLLQFKAYPDNWVKVPSTE